MLVILLLPTSPLGNKNIKYCGGHRKRIMKPTEEEEEEEEKEEKKGSEDNAGNYLSVD